MEETASEPVAVPTAAAHPVIHTYHCLCTHLVLASTHSLRTLPQRALAGQDKAVILPLPLLPHGMSESDTESELPRQSPTSQQPTALTSYALTSYAFLLSTTVDRNPQIVNREDGFEKRYLQRCGRCRLIVGYQLDWVQYAGATQDGRREDVVYLLPEGLVSTEQMAAIDSSS